MRRVSSLVFFVLVVGVLAGWEGIAAEAQGPVVVDTTGKTRFHRVFISGDTPFDKETSDIEDLFLRWDKLAAPGGTTFISKSPFIEPALRNRLNALRPRLEKGDEILIYYGGHGSNSLEQDVNGDEPDDFDNRVASTRLKGPRIPANIIDETRITDDELAEMIAVLGKDVTIVIIINTCFGGTFDDGKTDAKSIGNLRLMGPPGPISDQLTRALRKALGGAARPLADKNRDGILTADELDRFFRAAGGYGPTDKCKRSE